MQGKTHVVYGIASGLAVGIACHTHDPKTLVMATVAGGVAGLMPDWLQINIPGASKQLKGTFGHRGFSHWLWCAIAVYFLLLPIVSDVIAIAAAAGWLSHLILDMMAGGVPLLWPFGRTTFGHVKTSSNLDTFIGSIGLLLNGVLILMLL